LGLPGRSRKAKVVTARYAAIREVAKLVEYAPTWEKRDQTAPC
jgi:hypothetical protein